MRAEPAWEVIVVGGGAAGLMAAGRAAERGARVLLLEKTPRVGNKLRITGKGRCNLTNATDLRDFLAHLAPNGAFLRNGFARFFAPDLIAFFEARGLATVTERGKRVFPVSNDAQEVVAALERYGDAGGVTLRTGARVAGITLREGAVSGVTLEDGEALACQAVILATGGLSYPGTGSTGDGYRLARALGHTVEAPRPGLVPLVTAEAFVPRLQGLSLRNVRATLYQETRRVASEFGEMLFTHYGVSGPIILTLSLRAVPLLEQGPLRLVLDLKPALDEEVLDARLLRDLAASGRSHYHTLLKGLLPRSLVEVFAERSGIPLEQPLSQLTAAQRRRIRDLLKHFELTVLRARPVAEAIITQGGVRCDELDPKTMASRRVRGLYLAGELIDVAGDTGGHNLQVAFTTGWLAGQSAAEAVRQSRAASESEE